MNYPLTRKGLYVLNGMGHFKTWDWCYDLSEHNLDTATSIPYDICIIVNRIHSQTSLLKSFKGHLSIIIDSHSCIDALYSRLQWFFMNTEYIYSHKCVFNIEVTSKYHGVFPDRSPSQRYYFVIWDWRIRSLLVECLKTSLITRSRLREIVTISDCVE